MKQLFYLFLLLAGGLIYTACNDREDVEDPHNHSLLSKSPDEIRSKIAGKWQFKRGCGTGFMGYVCNNNWPPNDFLYFLPGDTVKRETNGFVVLYQKATIRRYKDYSYTDSVYLFEVGFPRSWVMREIKNDTLVVDDPGFQSTSYLVRP